MTLPSSGAISLNQINNEFGRGRNLNAYRGTTWYTDDGSSGTFTSTNLGMNQFYAKRVDAPYRYGSPYMYAINYGNSFVDLYWGISGGQPGAYFNFYLTSSTSGNPVGGDAVTGYLDGNGNYDGSAEVTDSYWLPGPQTNWFDVYQDGVYIGTVSASS